MKARLANVTSANTVTRVSVVEVESQVENVYRPPSKGAMNSNSNESLTIVPAVV